MKLELKHLDFTNNGKVRLTRLPHWDLENVELQNCELSFNASSKEPYLRYKDVTFGLDQIKVYKRPLSDLTKDEFYDLYIDLCEEIESVNCEYLLESLIKKTKYVFNLNDLDKLETFMNKNHFDWKYDLINNGLAIDINAL